jgi:hypothetical protein
VILNLTSYFNVNTNDNINRDSNNRLKNNNNSNNNSDTCSFVTSCPISLVANYRAGAS